MEKRKFDRAKQIEFQIQSDTDTLRRLKEATCISFMKGESNVNEISWLSIDENDDGLNKICYLFQQIGINYLKSEIHKHEAELLSL